MRLHVLSTYAHHLEVKIALHSLWYQEVKIALHSLWYHNTYRCDDTRRSSGGQNCITQYQEVKIALYRGCVMQF